MVPVIHYRLAGARAGPVKAISPRPTPVDPMPSLRAFRALAPALLALPLHAAPVQAAGPGLPGEEVVIGRWESIRSEILQEERRILVSTPLGYASEPDATYPVLYLLDGLSSFHQVVGTTTHMAMRGQMPPVVIVAVANNDRARDFSPPSDNPEIRAALPGGGGAEDFLGFLREELFPHVEAHLRCAPFRILHGHSSGGLFSTYAMLHAPETFDAYFAISPSLPYDRGALVTEAPAFFAEHPACDRFYYLTLADEEGPMAIQFAKMVGVLEQHAPASFRWGSMHLPDEDHGTTVLRSTYHALAILFADWRAADAFVGSDFAKVRAHFEGLTKRYGYPIAAPEGPVNTLGYEYLQAGDAARAREVFEYNAAHHPGSANVHDSLGECLEKLGDDEAALAAFEKACGIAEREALPALTLFLANRDRLRRRVRSQDQSTTIRSVQVPSRARLSHSPPARFARRRAKRAGGECDNRARDGTCTERIVVDWS